MFEVSALTLISLCNRFAKSHSVESVQYNNKREGPPDVDLSFLSADEKYTAIHDYRPVQDWLLFRPLNGT